MNFTDFYNQFNGHGVDYDGVYGAQCFDLIQEWNVNWLKNPFIPGEFAKQIMDADRPGYARVYNTPQNTPTQGSIIVWGGSYNGGPGHTGIATGKADVNTFDCFEQNDPLGSPAHVKTYSYKSVIGWLQPQGGGSVDDNIKRKSGNFDILWNGIYGTSVDTDKVTEQQVKDFVTWVQSNVHRAGMWDEECRTLGITSDSNQVTVKQLLDKMTPISRRAELEQIRDIAIKALS